MPQDITRVTIDTIKMLRVTGKRAEAEELLKAYHANLQKERLQTRKEHKRVIALKKYYQKKNKTKKFNTKNNKDHEEN